MAKKPPKRPDGPIKRPRVRGEKKAPRTLPKVHRTMQDDLEQTLDDIADTGMLPSDDIMEERFPGIRYDPVCRKEVFMRLIFTMVVRGYKIWEMSKVLRISTSSVAWYKRQIQKHQEIEIMQMSMAGLVGRSLMTYRELQAQAQKIVHDTSLLPTPRVAAIVATGNLEDSIIKMFKDAGFFRNGKLAPSMTNIVPADDTGADLRNFATAFLTGNRAIVDEAEAIDAEEDDYAIDENDINIV